MKNLFLVLFALVSMSKKERKPRWEVSYAMKDAAWRMIEDIRSQVREHEDRYMFPSKMVVSGAEIELTWD